MTLAFILYKYFPFGGLQRDFMRIALECQRRGHDIRVYTLIWEGDVPDGFEVLVAPVRSIFNHRRNEVHRVGRADLDRRPVQRVIGFNKMPGLDVYYAADACFEERPRPCATRCTASGAATATSPATNGQCSTRPRRPRS